MSSMISMVISFLQIYWKDIVYLVVALIVVIINLVKKKNVLNQNDEIKGMILSCLPIFIDQAEKVFGSGHGEEKRLMVIKLVLAYLKSHFKVDLSKYENFINSHLEMILSTPQRKEI